MLQRGTQRGNESLIFRKIQGYWCLTVRPWCLPAAPWVSDPRLSDWRALSSHTRQINQSQTASPLLFPGTRRVQRNSPRSACRSNSRPRSADLQRRADSKQVAEPPPSYDTRHQTFASPLLPVAERGYATHCTMAMSKRPESFIPWPLAPLARLGKAHLYLASRQPVELPIPASTHLLRKSSQMKGFIARTKAEPYDQVAGDCSDLFSRWVKESQSHPGRSL
jgi:hypothetical protein